MVTVSAVVASRASRAERRLENATTLTEETFERSALRSEWLMFHNERTVAQWKKLHERVTRLLLAAKKQFDEPANQSRLELLLGYQPGTAESFEKLQENWKAAQSGAIDSAVAKRVEDQLVGEMTGKAQEVAGFSAELARKSRLEMSRAVSLGVIMPVILIAALALLAVVDTLVISSKVLRRLTALREGAERVADGNPDNKIDESGRGEVAELAHAFNDMTGRLQGNKDLLEGLSDIYKTALTSETEAEIAGACLSVAERLTGSRLGFLGLVNERGRLDTKSLSEPGWKECRMPESAAVRLIDDMEITSFWGRVIKEGAPQVVNDPLSDPDSTGTPEGHPPINSFLGVPLRDRDETVGVIALANREGGFRNRDIVDLEALGVAFVEALSRRRAEDEVRRHRERLEEMVEERTAELKRALAGVQRSNSELQQYAYVASHDLQEPLRMVASYGQLLEKRYQGRLDEDADEFIGYMVDGVNRMQRLINDLLELSRIATTEKKIIPTDATSAVGVARANLEILLEESHGVVTNDTLPTLSADKAQLAQLFQNLIANSIKFRGKESPRVHISARQGEGEWVFSVTDNGIGFEPEHAERIFILFQRLNPRSAYGGTGIGLAISKSIVERHGGRIWAESVPGEGSTFYFTIPVRGGAA